MSALSEARHTVIAHDTFVCCACLATWEQPGVMSDEPPWRYLICPQCLHAAPVSETT